MLRKIDVWPEGDCSFTTHFFKIKEQSILYCMSFIHVDGKRDANGRTWQLA